MTVTKTPLMGNRRLGTVGACIDAADGDGYLAIALAVMLVRRGLWPGVPAPAAASIPQSSAEQAWADAAADPDTVPVAAYPATSTA